MKFEKSIITRKRMEPKDFETIMVLANKYMMSAKRIAEITDRADTTVTNVINANKCVDAEDWESAKVLVFKRASVIKYVEYFANKRKITIPADVYLACEEGKEYRKNKATYNYEDVEEEDECAFPLDELIVEEEPPEKEPMKSPDNNDVLYFVKLLELLGNTNELLEQLMDVVIPKYACDVKDNFNVNFDLVCERLKGCEDKLEKVVYNTRKRGN